MVCPECGNKLEERLASFGINDIRKVLVCDKCLTATVVDEEDKKPN